MEKSFNFSKMAIWGLGIAFVIFLVVKTITFSNGVIGLENQFEQKIDERTAFYSKMSTKISQVTQVAVKNDNSFKETVNAVMSGRKDADGLMMKWIKESNPNANYKEVSVMYRNLSRLIEAEREGFFVQEKVLQDIVRQHKDYIRKFPNSFINLFMGYAPLKYVPIQNETTQRVMKTGVETDADIKLNL